MPLVLEELQECVAADRNTEQEFEKNHLSEEKLPGTEQKVFLCRYWYMDSIGSISQQFGFSESKVKSMLFRTRNQLRTVLEKEGF